MAPSTAAPPDMSVFIRCMPSDGLIEMPPVSKVTPLPTSPSTAPVAGRGGLVAQHDQARRLRAAPRDAEQQPHVQPGQPVFVEHVDLEARLRRPTWTAISANARGVMTLAGSFASARARLLHAARMYPRAADRSAERGRLGGRLLRDRDQTLDGDRLGVRVALVDAAVVRRQRQALGGGLRFVGERQHRRENERHPAPAFLARRQRGGGGGAAELGGVETASGCRRQPA